MLTNENYFSSENSKKYMSVSQFKAFDKCPASALAEVSGVYEREKTAALLVGSYVDAHFEGTLNVFKAKNPELFKRDGTLKSEYINAGKMINRVEQDALFMEYMSGQSQVIMTGEIEGVPVKIKIDSYHPGRMIVDLKCMKDFAPIYKPGQGRLSWVEAWEYDLQGAVYQEIVRQNTGDTLNCYLAAVDKKPHPICDVIELPQKMLDETLDRIKGNCQTILMLKNGEVKPTRCESSDCDYCRDTHKCEVISTSEFELNETEGGA